MAQKVNITIGRFQPFTKGHLNMILEGELPCIIYRISSSKADSDMNKLKVKGKVVKPYIKQVMEPIDDLFLEIGNAFIKMCEGFTNDKSHHEIIDVLKNDIEDVCNEIEKTGVDEVKQQLGFQLGRLRKLGDDALNSAEGVVFEYKGKLMKLTGSFSALNQVLGAIKFSR